MKVYVILIDNPNPKYNHITRIFDSKEKAEKFIKEHIFPNVDIPYIEEWEVE